MTKVPEMIDLHKVFHHNLIEKVRMNILGILNETEHVDVVALQATIKTIKKSLQQWRVRLKALEAWGRENLPYDKKKKFSVKKELDWLEKLDGLISDVNVLAKKPEKMVSAINDLLNENVTALLENKKKLFSS